ncbi:MAG: biotin--[acetyl-CoA-carboxylase] ligase [Actinobacteria bacterium]|nr:biotin--[acetyl-CoA-carboxylase] ligase [Actinomycetota bacterium]
MDIKDVKRRRPALDPALILSELSKTSSKWLDLTVLEQVESTNDLAIAQLANASQDSVFAITADEQLKGRGRLQRQWQSPFGAGIALSVAIPTKFFNCEISAIPLLVGIAANNCLKSLGATSKLKWPNDLMIEMKSGELKKVGGILVQRLDDYVVIGIGINVDLNEDELPTDNATSLSLIDIRTSREALIAAIIYELENTTGLVSREWLPMYFQNSSTIGTQVTVARRAESSITGIAMNVLESGELILETNDGLVEISSGDVIQVRPTLP